MFPVPILVYIILYIALNLLFSSSHCVYTTLVANNACGRVGWQSCCSPFSLSFDWTASWATTVCTHINTHWDMYMYVHCTYTYSTYNVHTYIQCVRIHTHEHVHMYIQTDSQTDIICLYVCVYMVCVCVGSRVIDSGGWPCSVYNKTIIGEPFQQTKPLCRDCGDCVRLLGRDAFLQVYIHCRLKRLSFDVRLYGRDVIAMPGICCGALVTCCVLQWPINLHGRYARCLYYHNYYNER